MENKFPIKVPAIRVNQPLGEFYITKLTAEILLEVTFSDPLRLIAENYKLSGAQREEQLKRLIEIGRYIDTVEAAFPNSIILGANYRPDGELEENEEFRWHIDFNDNNECINLVIPTSNRLASIIDGQHRLHGFKKITNKNRLEMELLCAIYLDIPIPYQAYLFATINFNQKKVDRSLAYELWGYNLEDEPPKSWSPEKTAVFLCRKLNTDKDSPFYHHIIVAAQDDEILFKYKPHNIMWRVSTATIVDGILKLISSNPKKDKDEMHKLTIQEGRKRSLLEIDNSPLRKYYLETNDKVIYVTLFNFFTAVKNIFWSKASQNSYIIKTVGIQALFDVLWLILKNNFEKDKNISIEYFENYLKPSSNIDFTSQFFQASGLGRTRIKNLIAFRAGLISEKQLPKNDLKEYLKLFE